MIRFQSTCAARTAVGLLLAGMIAPAAGLAQAPAELEITFIGNMAFKISDGRTTLFSDFPYRSGAFGYMSYEMASVGDFADGVAIITHEHADHWDPGLFGSLELRLVADPAIARQIDATRIVPWSDRIVIRDDLVIEPIKTEHTDAHHSYRVTWGGIRMYFTGDTDSTSELLAQTELDLAFVSPWLAERVVAAGGDIDAERVVIYHHTPGERRPMPDNAEVPEQGQTFRVALR